MTQIVLTPDQVKLYYQAREPVQVCDPQGKVLGVLPPEYSAEFIAELKRRAREPGRRYTSEQITLFLKTLSEVWQREGPFDKERALQILKDLSGEEAR